MAHRPERSGPDRSRDRSAAHDATPAALPVDLAHDLLDQAGVGDRPLALPPDRGSPRRTHVFVFDDVVLKVDQEAQGRATRELAALRLLAPAQLPVPSPVAGGVLPDGRSWIVMTRLRGAPPADAALPAHRLSPDLAGQLGSTVALVHAAPAPASFGWTAGGTSLVEFDIRRSTVFADMAHRLGAVPHHEIDSLLGVMERTVTALDSAPAAPVLVHRDVYARNALVNADGVLTGLVDFEAAGGGDPMEDASRIALDWTTPAFAAFCRGYAAAGGTLCGDDGHRLAHHVLTWALAIFAYVAAVDDRYLAPARVVIDRIAAGERPDVAGHATTRI